MPVSPLTRPAQLVWYARAALSLTGFGLLLPLPALAATPADLAEPAAEAQTNTTVQEVLVTARRRTESLQDVPLSISALSGAQLERSGVTTLEQVTKIQPSLQLISSNARNTAVTIRGLGSNTGLTNDGLENGVGIYVDEVYFARPGSAVVELLDVARVEVLRGPQGTLFGKNTTAGAVSLTTRDPTFEPEGQLEVTAGNYGYLQGKAVVSGALLGDTLAGRLALIGTQRNGLLYNTTLKTRQEDRRNFAARGSLLFTPSSDLTIRASYDFSEQDPNAHTLAFVRYGPTGRSAASQFPALAAAFNYKPASENVYDRLVDVDAPLQARQILQGGSIKADWDLGGVTLTSVSAARNWVWRPSNDRDYTALDIRSKSQNPSEQSQWSQELRLASDGDQTLDWVIGLYAFDQKVETNGVESYGRHAARWLLGTSFNNTAIPSNLLDGLTARTIVRSKTRSYAAFGQATWDITPELHLTGGLRYTKETKSGDFTQTVTGGLVTTQPDLVNRIASVARNQKYYADFTDSSPSGQISLAWDVTPDVLTYVTVSRGFKSGGINAAGIPTDAAGNPALVSARIRPEKTQNLEAGIKTQWLDRRLTLNLAAYQTDIEDYQANVVDSGPGAIRGYLANIDKVEVRGAEFDARFNPVSGLSTYASLAWTDAKYASFRNGPPPLEFLTGTTAAYDLSGQRLPGVSEWRGPQA